MLSFTSASVRIANSERAVDECVEIAFEGREPAKDGVIIFNAAMGHKLDRVADALKRHAPDAQIVGTSCGGTVGREGAGESMTHLALMWITGPKEELAVSTVTDIRSANAYEKARSLAEGLQAKLPDARVLYLIVPGLDINCDKVLEGIHDVYGRQAVIFGGTSSDNYKGVTTLQYTLSEVTEHGAFLVGMADPTLKVAARASHGFTPYGEPMRVTKAEGNRILEIDGIPAWAAYAQRMSLIPEEDMRVSVLAAGGLAKELPGDIAEEYGNTHILRGAATDMEEGVMLMAVDIHEGEAFWLTMRDEALIFSEQEKALEKLRAQIGDHAPVAVFQSDCLARGRTLFNRVMKDELIGMMQSALQGEGEVPPWLGMYGFGEFCPLMDKNEFHTYTTSLMVLYR